MARRTLVVVIAALLFAGCASSDASGPRAAEAASATPNGKASAADPASNATRIGSSIAAVGSRLTPAQRQMLLVEHDRVRADVGVGPLRWSGEVAAYAQDWADRLVANGCDFAHRPDGRYGENIFTGTEGAFGVAAAARNWASEKKDYAGGALTRGNWYPAGHYTQMVWSKTRSLGCGSAACGGNTIVVCNYDPPGNRIGEKPY